MGYNRSVAADDKDAKKPPEKNYITPAGFRHLQTEFEELRWKKRREVVVKLAEAAAEGDRSENAEYIYRKKQLREIDRRIRFLMKRMSLAEVIDPSQHKSDRVCFGAIVSVEDADGKTVKYQIVGVDETEPRAGRISWNSPIGKALVNRRIDDEVSFRVAAGVRELTITDIEFPGYSSLGPSADARSIAAAQAEAQKALEAEPGEDGPEADDGEDDEEGEDAAQRQSAFD